MTRVFSFFKGSDPDVDKIALTSVAVDTTLSSDISNAMTFHPRSIKLDESGLSKVLGFLEAQVMEAVWARGESSVRDVRDAMERRKAYSFNTIMTVMNRLVDKKLLSKRESKGAYAYKAAVKKDDFIREVTKSVMAALLHDGSLFHAAAFVEVLRDCSEEDRRELRRLIEESA